MLCKWFWGGGCLTVGAPRLLASRRNRNTKLIFLLAWTFWKLRLQWRYFCAVGNAPLFPKQQFFIEVFMLCPIVLLDKVANRQKTSSKQWRYDADREKPIISEQQLYSSLNISHRRTRHRTRASAMSFRRITAWAVTHSPLRTKINVNNIHRLFIIYQLDALIIIYSYNIIFLYMFRASSSEGYSCTHAAYGNVTLYGSSWWPVGTQLEWEHT